MEIGATNLIDMETMLERHVGRDNDADYFINNHEVSS